jgi:hypothetical protein
VAAWIAAGPHREPVNGGTLVRFPLVHEGEALGCFEGIIPDGRYERMANDVIVVVVQMLGPVLAAAELSQDLASEVALRTQELQAQHNFACADHRFASRRSVRDRSRLPDPRLEPQARSGHPGCFS